MDNGDDMMKLMSMLFGEGANNGSEKPVEYESDGYSDYDDDDEKGINILKRMNKNDVTIDDLIEWGELYHSNKKKMCNGINLKTLWRIQSSLKKLKQLVGMKMVKMNIVGQILYYLQHLEKGHDDMLHTVIEGPPGVGKTELGKILGELYVKLGILQNKKINIDDPNFNINKIFKVVRRSDLVGKYVGHTAIKTQQVIDQCKGGVMFIDEAYSLGNKDVFSKECIDTINRNLSEQKANFLCIIAGYPNDLEKCFFAFNSGLRRRFPFKYSIMGYTPYELCEIFKLKVKQLEWSVKNPQQKTIPVHFFEKNMKYFPHFGGDMESLLLCCKIAHGKRVFGLPVKYKCILTQDDIKNGFNAFIEGKQNNEDDTSNMMMYI